jgi:formate--tetrahydrofolate ligase
MPLRRRSRRSRRRSTARDIACDPRSRAASPNCRKGLWAVPGGIAKTQFSFTTDPNAKGAPTDHVLSVREIRLSAGAEFVAICGEIMTMPGLPRVPAANNIDLARMAASPACSQPQ